MQMLATLVVAVTGAAFAVQSSGGQAPAAADTMKPPTIIKNVPPVYPPDARAARIEGRVVIEATISPAGTVSDAKVIRSIPMLDQAAVDAVKQWVYEPTIIHGKPVAVIMTVTVNFALDSAAPAKPAEPPPSFDALIAALRFAEAEPMARTAAEHLALGRALADTAPLASAAERARNLASAEDHFKRAIELAPDPAQRSDAMHRLHGYYLSDNPARRAEADAFFKSAAERYSNEPAAHMVLASLLYSEKTMDAYIDAMRRVGTRFPKDAEVRALVASALRDSIKVNPKTPEARQRTLLAEARTGLDEALTLDPESQLALLTKALVLRDLAGLEKDQKRAAALEAEAQRLIDQQIILEARKPK